jgi:membrane protein YqaA with SNARE-associated domain
MMYFIAFLSALVVDTIPVIAPPAWTILTFLIVKFKLNPWGVVILGTIGSTLGRYILSLYIPKVSKKMFSARENKNVHYIGEKIGKRFWPSFLFVLIYSITPLSTTALFTAAGVANLNPLYILPPFFIGKFTSDAVMVFTGRFEAHEFKNLLHGKIPWHTAIVAVLGLILIFAMLFIDWAQLLEHKKLRFRFNIFHK